MGEQERPKPNMTDITLLPDDNWVRYAALSEAVDFFDYAVYEHRLSPVLVLFELWRTNRFHDFRTIVMERLLHGQMKYETVPEIADYLDFLDQQGVSIDTISSFVAFSCVVGEKDEHNIPLHFPLPKRYFESVRYNIQVVLTVGISPWPESGED